MAEGDNTIVMTRHMATAMPEYAITERMPDGQVRTADGVGVVVERPWPTARMYYITHANGWFYVYWIDDKLSKVPQQ